MKTQSMAFNLAFLLLSCLAVPVLACCLPPQPPCYRCEDGVWVNNCSAGQKCCTDSGSYCCNSNQTCCKGTCCEPDKFCCNDKCCKNWQCCINGNCVDPICDNCHDLAPIWFYECGHLTGEEGETCATDWCITNCLTTATCDYKGDDWPCGKSHCDTAVMIPMVPASVQLLYAAPCPGGTTHFVPVTTVWYGCGDYCNGILIRKACDIFWCGGTEPFGVGTVGFKSECGCPLW